MGVYPTIMYNYAFWPSDLLQGQFLWTLFTNLFLHADIFHIFFNMLTLIIFGIDVEYGLGKINYILIYFFSGVAANLLHFLTTLAFLPAAFLYIPTVGASGAIFGVMGAYLFLFPGTKVDCMWGAGSVLRLPYAAVKSLSHRDDDSFKFWR